MVDLILRVAPNERSPKEPVEVPEPLIVAVFVVINPLVKAPLTCVAI